MTTEIVTLDQAAESHNLDPHTMRQFVMDGDLSQISPAHRPALVMALCRYIGVDPIERPFLVFNDGKRQVLYAARSCTSALCRLRGISREIMAVDERKVAGQLLIVARARASVGTRHDEATGVVPVMQAEIEWRDGANGRKFKNVTGWRMPTPDEAANLVMKAETKAKRRAVLDLVGLGLTDESELETMRVRRGEVNMSTGAIVPIGEPVTEPEIIDVEIPTAEHAALVRDLDGAIKAYAKMLGAKPAATWKAACKAAKISAARPDALDLDAARTMLRLVCSRMADACASAYEALDAVAPGDYVPENMHNEFCAITGLDVWPDLPGHELLADIHQHLTETLAKITSEDDPT